MTPKEKAKQLVDKYYGITDVNWGIRQQKESALITVAEIIEAIDWHEFEPPNREFEFWDEVKTEIERL